MPARCGVTLIGAPNVLGLLFKCQVHLSELSLQGVRMAVVLWVGKTDLGMKRIWRAEVKLGKVGQKFFTSLCQAGAPGSTDSAAPLVG